MVRERFHQSCVRSWRRVPPLVAIVLGLNLSPIAVQAADDTNPACRKDSRVIAACFTVHGHISNWNGNPTRRIWITGTKRMLGVRDGTDLPAPLNEALGDFDHEVNGDFDFCPFTPQKPGVMQVGCIAGVSNYQIKKRDH
jgi:hypothetical protein